MNDKLEREIRSIERQYRALKKPIEDFEILDSLSPPIGLRYGSVLCIVIPHEGILDEILNFAQSVWHFKDYLKDAAPAQSKAIETFAEQTADLKVCADLANEKKHSSLNRPRSKQSPKLGITRDGSPMVGVVAFDTSRNGMIEFAYNGKTKRHRFWVTHQIPISFYTDVLVSADRGPISSGNAVDFVYSAFQQWEQLMQQLKIQIRSEFVGE